MGKIINEKLKKLFNDGILSHLDYTDYETADDLIEGVEELISEEEIIYYSNAIKYLSEYDASLQESLSIAHDFGYGLNNINSEILATILYQQNLREELYRLRSDIKNIYAESGN